MHSSGINGEGESKVQLANPGPHGKMVINTYCVYHPSCHGKHS